MPKNEYNTFDPDAKKRKKKREKAIPEAEPMKAESLIDNTPWLNIIGGENTIYLQPDYSNPYPDTLEVNCNGSRFDLSPGQAAILGKALGYWAKYGRLETPPSKRKRPR